MYLVFSKQPFLKQSGVRRFHTLVPQGLCFGTVIMFHLPRIGLKPAILLPKAFLLSARCHESCELYAFCQFAREV